MQSKYTVCEKAVKHAIVWGCLFAVIIIGFVPIIMIIITEGFGENKNLIIFSSVFWLFIFACNLGWLYSVRRPRIKTDGEMLICYPKNHKKEVVSIYDITARRTAPHRNTTVYGGDPLSSAIAYAASDHGPLMQITYFSGKHEIISIHTGMKNAKKLDAAVRSRLSQ